MSFIEEVIALLKAAFPTLNVYRNFIPEGVTKPSLVVSELSNVSSRVLSGVKFGLISNWRVGVYVKDDAAMKPLLDILENLDDTSNNDFQKIFSDYVLTEARQPDQTLTRAFYDLTLYK